MKILNLYSGIGGNRRLWGNEHSITAVEMNPKIAEIYQDFFPNDKMVVGDAHDYLLDHFAEFDFIWASPPCPSHSSLRKGLSMAMGSKAIYPDMKLYEEILLLKHYFNGKYCVENVMSYYEPLIKPCILQRHYFWVNFHIPERNFKNDGINLGGKGITHKAENQEEQIERMEEEYGFDLAKYKVDKRTALRNCISPRLGLHILNESKRDIQPELFR